MKKFIKGTFKFKRLKSPTTNPARLANSIIQWADTYGQSVSVYMLENDITICVDYRLVASSATLCKELVKSLKSKAKEWGSIELVSEMSGEQV